MTSPEWTHLRNQSKCQVIWKNADQFNERKLTIDWSLPAQKRDRQVSISSWTAAPKVASTEILMIGWKPDWLVARPKLWKSINVGECVRALDVPSDIHLAPR